MSRWRTAEAKQRLSEVIRRSAEEPQQIYRRDELVAVVISAADFEAFHRFRCDQQSRTLGQAFAEVRELATRYDYDLVVGERRDRQGWVPEP